MCNVEMKAGAILLDRDGTIIVERNYLSDPALVELAQGAIEGLARLQSAGWRLVVLTNQSGVARGYFSRAAVDAVNDAVAVALAERGIAISGWYVCPHGPEDDCDCRKPKPGLALDAAAALDIDLAASWMIGDKISDVAVGRAVGGRSVLIRSSRMSADDEAAAAAAGACVAADLNDAADMILQDSDAMDRA